MSFNRFTMLCLPWIGRVSGSVGLSAHRVRSRRETWQQSDTAEASQHFLFVHQGPLDADSAMK